METIFNPFGTDPSSEASLTPFDEKETGHAMAGPFRPSVRSPFGESKVEAALREAKYARLSAAEYERHSGGPRTRAADARIAEARVAADKARQDANRLYYDDY